MSICHEREVLVVKELSLEAVAHAAEWMARYTTPFLDQKEIDGGRGNLLYTVGGLKEHLNLRDKQYPDGHTTTLRF